MQGQLDQESSVCESRLIDMILYFVLCSSSWTSYHSPILIISLCLVLLLLLLFAHFLSLMFFTKESVASRSRSLFTHQRLQFLSSVVFFLPSILFISSPLPIERSGLFLVIPSQRHPQLPVPQAGSFPTLVLIEILKRSLPVILISLYLFPSFRTQDCHSLYCWQVFTMDNAEITQSRFSLDHCKITTNPIEYYSQPLFLVAAHQGSSSSNWVLTHCKLRDITQINRWCLLLTWRIH